ncbi:MAG: DUF3566 domain-containing protein [Propionibacteriaceae bacterium]|jgi:hypothetical protein|nr:DUF3566 domain-containing protein [Propionibacteriaceae bacterium]
MTSVPAAPVAAPAGAAALGSAAGRAATTAELAPLFREAPIPPPPSGSAIPVGHLGAVPQTSAPLPVLVEAAPPTTPPHAPARSVTPTAIKPASKDRQTRKARLRLARIDPWSIMKTALLFGVAGAIMLVVAVYAVFTVIDQTGIYEAVNKTVSTLFTSSTGVPFDIKTYVNTERAVGVTAILGAVDVVIVTALATIFGALYNLAANIMGGIEVTLAED